ncbi:hypothetical protein G6O69_13685 [Pseudenhygromyxa sp. WMMC2535]|uniref:hypothetical protein n=1 Tax=Pseudenhygromyxa sp. WMMC2535 TaxID=2712867 RepID=UPI001557BD94|nr:hypothetical protein [Pseudenhygromyxa sp. WMMC2535]NVB38888.1 hypothetical protein [Pseudenhygromyxa sp. WMMC2535]
MSQLSNREIEEAAREAGISPAELRSALAEQAAGGGALVPQAERGLVPPSPRGRSDVHSESALPFPPEQAVRSVKHQLERQLGAKGHMQGGNEADIYDESNGLIYRIQSQGDGGGGALVRVDVDATPMRGRRTLASMGLGATIGLFAIAGLIIPGWIGWALIAGAVALGLLGSTSLFATRSRALANARAYAAQALIEAEHAAPIGGALPAAEADRDA